MDLKCVFALMKNAALFLLICSTAVWSQAERAPVKPSRESLASLLHGLETQVAELKTELKEVRQDAANSRANEAELQRELESTRAQLASLSARAQDDPKMQVMSSNGGSEQGKDQNEPVDEKLSLLNNKINEQYQTKVESGSRYRVRFSGLLLLNAFANRGNVDTIEVPRVALPFDTADGVKGSIGGTLRQTEFGFQVVGPTFLQAKTSGNVEFDFAGGLAPTPGGATMGVVRMRTGTVRLDWDNTSVVAGQDGLFFSPFAPTSYASLEEPALAYAGTLWGWVPQVRIEHRIDSGFGSNLTLQAGLLDPSPAAIPDSGSNMREPSTGEQTREPGLGTHIGWSRPLFGRSLSIGAGGYHGKQQYQVANPNLGQPVSVYVPSWLASTDWEIPVSHWVRVTGSLYRGRALGDLGGGLGQSITIVPALSNPYQIVSGALTVKGLMTEGGWSQLKIQPLAKFEWNLTVGEDNPFARQLRASSQDPPTYLPLSLTRNRAAMANMIFRPRSDLLLALEFRHLQSFPTHEQANSANQANLAMGILF